MKIEEVDGSIERKILISFITNKRLLSTISPKWTKDGLFKSRWSNLIAKWCISFYQKYNKPPCDSIESIFRTWATSSKDNTTVELIDTFLSSLSGEYERQTDNNFNTDYIIDLAANYFNDVSLLNLSETIQADVTNNKSSIAIDKITKFTRIKLGSSSGINVLQDEQSVIDVFRQKEESLIQLNGPMAYFYGDSLQRDCFIAFMAPEKRGKSFFLLDFAWRCMLQRRRVALFEVGDMSQNQVMRRIISRACNRPFGIDPYKYPKKLRIEGKPSYKPVVSFETIKHDKPLTKKEALAAFEYVQFNSIKSKKPYFKLSVHPNNSVSVNDIRSTLDAWDKEESWVPDVIIIDYADILLALNTKDDRRDQINTTWMSLRALSQERHCLVITATQSDAASYKSFYLDKSNFSEDKRKLSHVTGMIGINQTIEEKELGISRLNWVVRREGSFLESKYLYVAGCLSVSNPCVLSVI